MLQANTEQLIRGKRNFTRTAVHAAPKPFLFIALSSMGTERLTMHLVRCLLHESDHISLTWS